jgi:hypothetical protein
MTLLLASYAGFAALAAASILASRQPVLLKGVTLARFNFLFALLFLLVGVLQREALPLGLVAAGVLLGAAWPIRRPWLIFRATPGQISSLVESSLARMLIRFEGSGRAYALAVRNANASIRVSSPFPGIHFIRFNGDWRHRKARLAAQLMAKRLRGIIPLITIRV